MQPTEIVSVRNVSALEEKQKKPSGQHLNCLSFCQQVFECEVDLMARRIGCKLYTRIALFPGFESSI